MIEQRIHTVL